MRRISCAVWTVSALAALVSGCIEEVPSGDLRPKVYETRGRLVELADIASSLESQSVDLATIKSVEELIETAATKRVLPKERTANDYCHDPWGHAYTWNRTDGVIEIRSPGGDERDDGRNSDAIVLRYDTKSTEARKFKISIPE
jgi:hypothetical protein